MKHTFILAQEFRQEINDRVSAIGLYPTNAILINKTPELIEQKKNSQIPPSLTLDRLGFLISTTGKKGNYNIHLEVIDPSGEKVFVSEKGVAVIESLQHGHSYLIQTNMFPVSKMGDYICRYYFNGKPTDFKFYIDIKE